MPAVKAVEQKMLIKFFDQQFVVPRAVYQKAVGSKVLAPMCRRLIQKAAPTSRRPKKILMGKLLVKHLLCQKLLAEKCLSKMLVVDRLSAML